MNHIHLVRFFIMLLVSILPLSSMGARLIPVESDPAPGEGLVVMVRDAKGLIVDASVWVETPDGQLISEGRTTERGTYFIPVEEKALNEGVNVTAWKAGHAAVSFLDNVSHQVALELPITPTDQFAVLNGRLTGFEEPDDEMIAQVGFVAKAIEMNDLAQFDPSYFVSPLDDTIDVFGKRNIPSNIVLPDQTFPIFFFPVHVNKPYYRLPVPAGSSNRYFGMSGLIDVEEAVDLIRAKNPWGLLNELDVTAVGLSQKVHVPDGDSLQGAFPTMRLDVAADTAIRDRMRLNVNRSRLPDNQKRLFASLWEPLPGLFVPTDIKVLERDQIDLTAVNGRKARIMDILVEVPDEDEVMSKFRGAWARPSKKAIPKSSLTASLEVGYMDKPWRLSGGGNAQLVVAHLEDREGTAVGSTRYEDQWVLIARPRGRLTLPSYAYKKLGENLRRVNYVSVDWLQVGSGGYPFVNGEEATGALQVFEKVRRPVTKFRY